MSTKTVDIKKVANSKPITIGETEVHEDFSGLSEDGLALRYEELRLEDKRISALRDQISGEVKRRMEEAGVTSIEAQSGTFHLDAARSFSWSVETLKDVLGRSWTSFVKSDDKLVRARMENKDLIGCSLEATANVTVTPKLRLAVKK